MAAIAAGGGMKVVNFSAKKKQADRNAYKGMAMDAWDRLFPNEREAKRIGKPERLDTDPEVRRKAKQQL